MIHTNISTIKTLLECEFKYPKLNIIYLTNYKKMNTTIKQNAPSLPQDLQSKSENLI